ncbi:MAG: hypothetical protein HYU86_04730 [Chloroflexi bacterium]|nr:hypothetical protein [Chloroflexota bacterium]
MKQAETRFQPKLLVVHKRGKDCVLAKLVVARPLGEIVLAMPYRNRRRVDHVSLPPRVLQHARREGATWWIVRLDCEGLCYGLPLAQVEDVGWLATSEDEPEWFVPLTRFQSIPWQEWFYVSAEDYIDLKDTRQTYGRQLPLIGVAL